MPYLYLVYPRHAIMIIGLTFFLGLITGLILDLAIGV